MAKQLLSELIFGSYLVYSPRGQSEISIASQKLCRDFKAGVERVRTYTADHLAQGIGETELDAVLGPDVALVPCPRSHILKKGYLWPGHLIAQDLLRVGLGKEVITCLERTQTVAKSAYQKPGERLSALKHYETMAVSRAEITANKITVVDDVITKGNTLLAAASRLAEAYPRKSVMAFGIIRTKGLIPEIDGMLEPCLGSIRLVNDESDRQP